jgi:hypothetical protein
VALSDFSTLFSRQFLIGFFAPPLAGLFVLSQALPDGWLPAGYRAASGATQAVIVGVAATGAALLLSGLQRPIIRLLEGYPLMRRQSWPLVGAFVNRRLGHWTTEFDKLAAELDGPPSRERTRAALRLNDSFPATKESVLPTEIGNVLRSFETHPRRRYGLDGIAIWPLVNMLLSDGETTQLEDASADMHFWVNGLLAVVITGATLATAAAVESDGAWGVVFAVAVVATVVLSWLSYQAAVTSARGWGRVVRAAYDLHRLEI